MTLFSASNLWLQEEHALFAESARRFFADELVPHAERWAEQGQVDREFWQQAGEFGLMSGSIAEVYGGVGGGMTFDAIALYEQAAVGDVGWGFAIQSIVMHYVQNYGTEQQKLRWLPKLVSGELIAALAMTEPGTGSDLQAIKTTAAKQDNNYVLNGSKTFITNGHSANLIVVAAKTEKNSGAKGVSLIGLEVGLGDDEVEGFRRGRNLKKLGMKGNDTAELFFDDVRVPVENLLGETAGKGFYQLMNQLPWERLIIGISALGCIDFALKETLAYVRERQAFGQRIMDFQNTRFKLAEVKTKAELLRSFVNDCLYQLEQGQLDAATASMVKYWGSQTQNEVMNECLQLFGGYGYMMEYPIARLYADARVQMIYGGSNEIMKELIARSIDR